MSVIIQKRCGSQFAQPRETKALQKCLRRSEAQTAVATGKFLHKLEIAECHDEAALVGVEKAVDFRLTDRLLKGDAGEHFEGRGREFKISARAALFAQICGQRLVVDLCSQKRNHPVDNSELKADKGELPVAGNAAR